MIDLCCQFLRLSFRDTLKETRCACLIRLPNRVQHFATPRAVAHQAPLSRGFCRQEYWRGLPFSPSGYLPNPGMEPPTSGTRVCCLPGGFFTIESRGKLPFRDTIYVNVWYVKCAGFSFLILLDITRSSSKKGSSNWHFHQQMYEWLSYPHPYQDWTLSFAGGLFFCLFCQSDGISLCYFHVHFLDFWRAWTSF